MMAPSGPLVTTLASCPEDGPPSPDPKPEEPPDAHATSATDAPKTAMSPLDSAAFAAMSHL